MTIRLLYTTGATQTTRIENSGEPAGYFTELGWDVATRAAGDNGPVMTGVTCAAAGCDFRTFKYGATLGVSTWNITDGGIASNDAQLGGGITYTNDNRLVVAGATCLPDFPNCSARMQRRVGDSGVLLWDVTLPIGPTSVLQAVANGPDANPVATGYTCNGANCSFATTKLLLQYPTAVATITTRSVSVNGGQAVADGMTVTFNRVTAAGNTTFQTSNTGFPQPAPCAAWRPDASWREILPGPYNRDNHRNHHRLPELHQPGNHRRSQLPGVPLQRDYMVERDGHQKHCQQQRLRRGYRRRNLRHHQQLAYAPFRGAHRSPFHSPPVRVTT